MYRGVKVKLYPNKEQQEKMNQMFGNDRFVWNQMLGMLNERYENNPDLPMLGKYDLSKLLVPLKKEYEFLKASDSSSLVDVTHDIRDAFDRFFKGIGGYPKFKSKYRGRDSYTSRSVNNNLEVGKSHIKLPKLGWMRARGFNISDYNRIMSATISKNSKGDYQASVLVEYENSLLEKTGKQIGLDFGMTDLIIGSDGMRIESKSFKEYEDKLVSWQKKMSRRLLLAKERGVDISDAKNYQEAKKMVAKYHERIKNSRDYYLHNVTKKIVEEYDFIVIEDLKVKSMASNPNNKSNKKAFNKKINSQSWYTLRVMLEYKAEKYGKELVVVNPAYTSQTCSACGHLDGKKELDIREWTCGKCGAFHDRDINAAINILNKGLKIANH